MKNKSGQLDQPTPETDAATWVEVGYNSFVVSASISSKLERERDEVLAQVKELIYIAERAIALAEIDFENDKFGVVSELRDGLEKIKEEA